MQKELAKNIKKEITYTAEVKNLTQLNPRWVASEIKQLLVKYSHLGENQNPRLFSDLIFVNTIVTKWYMKIVISHHAASMWYSNFFLQKYLLRSKKKEMLLWFYDISMIKICKLTWIKWAFLSIGHLQYSWFRFKFKFRFRFRILDSDSKECLCLFRAENFFVCTK